MTKQDIHRNHLKSPADLIVRFSQDRTGNVTMLFGLMAIVLTLSIGAAVDLGRWLHARDQTSGAIDAAVLAGARYLQTNRTDQAGAIAAAKKFYVQNVTTRLPVTDDTVSFAVTDGGASVTSSGSAYIKTPFLQLANIAKLPLFAPGQSQVPGKAKAEIPPVEIALMVDVTGSMADCVDKSKSCASGSKLAALKVAATKMFNIMLPDGLSNPSAKISIVPFSEDVRLPSTSALNLARGTGLVTCKRLKKGVASTCSPTQTPSGSTDYFLTPANSTPPQPCVVERSGNSKYSDAGPSGNFVMAHYASDTNGDRIGKCTIPAGSEIMPLSSSKTALLAKINGLNAGGGTAGHIGTAWAWYTLSPNWSSLWPSNAPQAYGAITPTGKLRKIAILMTDGAYNLQYDKNGVQTGLTNAGSAVNGTSAVQAAALCTAMKAQGTDIEIYTIGFGSEIGGPGAPAYELLSQCAAKRDDPSDRTRFYAPVTDEQLSQAFNDIGLKLSSLYLSK